MDAPPRKRARTCGRWATLADPATLGFSARRLDLPDLDTRAFDAQMRAGMRRFLAHHGHDPGPLTDAALRDAMKPDKDDPLAGRKRAARDGNAIAQFRPGAGLRASGFGVWNHLRGLEAGLAITEAVAAAWGYRHTGGVPHLIAKMPSDTAADARAHRWKSGTLAPHIDGGSFADAHAAALKHAADPDMAAWGTEYGEQMLAHLQIGRTGHTCTLWHLTPWRYGIVLSLVRHGFGTALPALPEAKWTTAGGPQFYKHDMGALAAAANAVIHHVRHGGGNDQVVKFVARLDAALTTEPGGQRHLPDIVPGPMIDLADAWAAQDAAALDAALTAPTVVAWGRMVLHWVTATGPTPRYTFTMPLAQPSSLPHAPPGGRSEGLEHLQLVGEWKDADTPEERAGVLGRIRARTTPWAGGQVHKQPGATEAANMGFWEEAMAGRERVARHIALMTRQ